MENAEYKKDNLLKNVFYGREIKSGKTEKNSISATSDFLLSLLEILIDPILNTIHDPLKRK